MFGNGNIVFPNVDLRAKLMHRCTSNNLNFDFTFFPQVPFPDLALDMSLEWQLSQNTLLAVLHMMMERIAQEEELRQELGDWTDIDEEEELRQEMGDWTDIDEEEELRQEMGDWTDIDDQEQKEEGEDLEEELWKELGDWRDIDKEEKGEEDGDLDEDSFPFVNIFGEMSREEIFGEDSDSGDEEPDSFEEKTAVREHSSITELEEEDFREVNDNEEKQEEGGDLEDSFLFGNIVGGLGQEEIFGEDSVSGGEEPDSSEEKTAVKEHSSLTELKGEASRGSRRPL